MDVERVGQPVNDEEIEGIELDGGSWGDYPIDDLLIRPQNRTIHDVTRRSRVDDWRGGGRRWG